MVCKYFGHIFPHCIKKWSFALRNSSANVILVNILQKIFFIKSLENNIFCDMSIMKNPSQESEEERILSTVFVSFSCMRKVLVKLTSYKWVLILFFFLSGFLFTDTDGSKDTIRREGTTFIPFYHYHSLTNIEIFFCSLCTWYV